MFMALVNKVYMVNKSSVGIEGRDIRYVDTSNKKYEDIKKSYPMPYLFFKELSALRERRGGLTLFIVRDKDFNLIASDYLGMLGLGYEEYLLIREHSNFCTEFCDNCNELISRHDDCVPMPNPEDYRPTRRLTKDFEMFPAEYAINCLDQDWARHKFLYFRAYGLYNAIKEYQVKLFQLTGKQAFPEFSDSDQSAKALMDGRCFTETLRKTFRLGLDTDDFNLPLKEWAKKTYNAGYDRYSTFKYNARLAQHLYERGYRIDQK